MDSLTEETPRQNFKKSELISHQLKTPNMKSRSNSINGDLDQDDKSLNSNDVVSEKLDFNQIRNRFESTVGNSPGPPPIYPRKRTSMPGTISNTPPELPPKPNSIHRGGPVLPPKPLPKSRSSSPAPPVRQTNNAPPQFEFPRVKSIHHSSVSVDEDTESSSTISINADEPSAKSENEIDERSISVKSIRDMFDKEKKFPLPRPEQSTKPMSSKPGRLSIPNTLNIPTSPLPQSTVSPERFIKTQTHDILMERTDSAATGDSSLSSNPHLSPSNSSDASFSDEDENSSDERKIKLRRCLEEVHTTEKTYVNVLYVLAVKLSKEVKNTCDTKDENLILIFNQTYKSLLGNIQQIYHLHHDIILPEMERYITGQTTENMWSILEKNFKVIEVLYKNYYVTYYDTQGKLDELCRTQPLINEAMLQCQTYLGNLYPTTQLNCPNQRLLRYILCMKTYMKYLDLQSVEYQYSRAIHDELDRIAMRCEEELVISAAQLNELKERLDGKFECFKENRKLLWHGPLKKQSPRKHLDIAQRYMILFSDCILVCSEESGRKLEINRELTLRGITIGIDDATRASIIQTTEQSNVGMVYYPFRVNAVEKSYEFLVDKESDREIWVKKIRQASADYNKRISTIELRQSGSLHDEQQLGIRAPAWVNDVDVTRCQNCHNRFRSASISSRRHHCRSCGCCVCSSCSTKKLALPYCQHENEVRVCDKCYVLFTGFNLNKNTSVWPKPTREVEQTVLFGDFRGVQSGTIVWIALQEDYQLHIYGGKLDQAEDYAIKLPEILDIQLDSDTRTFTLRETTKTHTFAIDQTHQIVYEKNELLDEKLKNSESRLSFYTNLWSEAMHLARSTTLPDWYIRKRVSSDSGVSNVG